LCLLSDLSRRVKGRQECSWLEGSLFDLTRMCRGTPAVPDPPEHHVQQETFSMTGAVAGIDPHQDTFTVGIVDRNGVELVAVTFPNRGSGYLEAVELLATHRVDRVGVEGTASWGQHVAIALAAAGLDVREVPAQRSAQQRRARRLAKTDVVDAVAAARALLAEPTLGPAQALEIYDPLFAKIEAVLEHRRGLVEARTLMLHYAQDQLAKLPSEIRDQLPTTGKIESRLRKLDAIDITIVSAQAGAYRLSWLLPLIDQDRAARRQIRQLERDLDDLLDTHGTTLRDEAGIGPIAAATLLGEVGDPFRFARESKFARWSGTGAVALSSGEGDGPPVRHRLDFRGNRRINSVLYIASVTQQRDHDAARTYINRKTTEGKTRREARRAHKRHLANRVIRRMWADERRRATAHPIAA
jgi:transposase